jgi:hypothetical protein
MRERGGREGEREREKKTEKPRAPLSPR